MMRLLLPSALSVVVAAGCATTRPAETLTPEKTAEAEQAAAEGITNAKAAQHFQDSVALLQNNNSSDARRKLELAFEADPTFAVAKYNLAVLTEKEGKHDEAVKIYRQAYDADPSFDLAVENLGVILESRGMDGEAEQLYRDAIARNSEAVYPRVRLAKLAYRRGDAKGAVELARAALQFDAKSVDAYRLLARLYAENGKNQLARLIAVRGQKLSPNDPELVYALAIVTLNEKNVAGARELLNRVIQTDPDHVEARVKLAQMALDGRDWKTAEPQLQALIAKEPENGALYTNLGLALKGQGRFDEAAKSYEQAVELGFGAAALNLGILELRNTNKPEEAEKHLDRYLSMGGSRDSAAPLIEEARTMIEAKREEMRMMEEMKRQEEEEAKLAAEAAKNPPPPESEGAPAEGEGEGAAPPPGEQPPGQPPAEEAKEEEEPPPPPKAPPKKKKAPPKKKPDEKKKAPSSDDEFFE